MAAVVVPHWWIGGDWWGFTVHLPFTFKINGNPNGDADFQILHSIDKST